MRRLRATANEAGAVSLIPEKPFLLIRMDDQMQEMSGLNRLIELKETHAEVSAVTLTKGEEDLLFVDMFDSVCPCKSLF